MDVNSGIAYNFIRLNSKIIREKMRTRLHVTLYEHSLAHRMVRGLTGCSPLQNENLINTDYVDRTVLKVLRQLPFSL